MDPFQRGVQQSPRSGNTGAVVARLSGNLLVDKRREERRSYKDRLSTFRSLPKVVPIINRRRNAFSLHPVSLRAQFFIRARVRTPPYVVSASRPSAPQLRREASLCATRPQA